MSVVLLSTLGTVLAGLTAVLLVPFLARRGSRARAIFYGLVGAVFCFSFMRWIAGLVGAAFFDLPHSSSELLTGGLPLRGVDGAIFAVFLALTLAMSVAVRRARA